MWPPNIVNHNIFNLMIFKGPLCENVTRNKSDCDLQAGGVHLLTGALNMQMDDGQQGGIKS